MVSLNVLARLVSAGQQAGVPAGMVDGEPLLVHQFLDLFVEEAVYPVNGNIGTRQLADPVEGPLLGSAAGEPTLQLDILKEYRQVPGAMLDLLVLSWPTPCRGPAAKQHGPQGPIATAKGDAHRSVVRRQRRYG